MALRAESTAEGPAVYCEIEGLEVTVDLGTFTPVSTFLRTPAPFVIDQELEVFLRAPAGSLTISALVVQVVTFEEAVASGTLPGIGVLFTDLNSDQREFLRRLASANESTKPPPSPAASKRPHTSGGRARRTNAKRINGRQATTRKLDPKVVRRPVELTRKINPRSLRAKPPSPAEPVDAVIQSLRKQLDRLSSHAPWRVLKISNGAGQDEAKAAYLRLTKEYHPHRFAHYHNDEVTNLVTQIFIGIKQAYQTTCRRTRTDADRSTSGRPPEQ
ncbi:MAG: hypothetical protein OXU20_17120 [Myxococcales bacterium]|nr:hypothetical protein [Myxococcales bacterium]